MQTKNHTQVDSLPALSLCMLRVSIADMISLNVRTKGSKNLECPECLYQSIPMRSATLMATIPVGSFAVSIPGIHQSMQGYAILKTPTANADGFVIIYIRRPNGRYEAARVLYQNTSFEIAEFVSLARQWVKQHHGSLQAKPGCFAYFAPSKAEWGCIQRDSGYIAGDHSRMPSEITPELHKRVKENDGSRVLARIPVFMGENQSAGESLNVFARVEITLEADPGPQSIWISFVEYLQSRILHSRLPDAIVPDFREWLSHFTEESGFEYWIFQSGMLLGDCAEWWGDGCRRRTEHEGIDFARGFRAGAGSLGIEDGVPVRAIANGEVAAILDDFIGNTVVMRYSAMERSNGDVFYTFLSHIQPLVAKQDRVAKGQIVGRIGKSTSTIAPLHLHLTGAWIPNSIAPNEVSLDCIHPAFAPVSLADFLPLLRNNPLCHFDVSA
jgi:murein DD-endopeptidase MepM/ murein hydrolase activator NlpD